MNSINNSNSSRHKKQQKRACFELDAPSCSESDDNTPSANYDRWFIIQSTEEDKSIAKLSPFIISRALKAAAGNLKTVRRLQKGDILLEVSSAVQSRCINNLNNLAGCPILVTPHRSLNTSKGVIRCRELLNCNKDEILSELKSQHVKDITNISEFPSRFSFRTRCGVLSARSLAMAVRHAKAPLPVPHVVR